MTATPFTLKQTAWTAYREAITLLVAIGVMGFLRPWSALLLAPVGLARVCFGIRSIDVERDGLRVRSLLRRQFVPFSSLGEFRWLYGWNRGRRSSFMPRRYAYVQADLLGGSTYRSLGILPSETLSFAPRFRIAGEDNVLSAEDLVALLNKCRAQSGS